MKRKINRLLVLYGVLIFALGMRAQIQVNCSNLALSQDTFYLSPASNTHVIADLNYLDTNIAVYPVLRLILEDTTIVKALNIQVLSFLAYPIDSIEAFDFEIQFKSITFPHNTVVNAWFHIYDSDTAGDSIVSCHFPVRLVLQQPVLLREDSRNLTCLKIYPNPVKSNEEIRLEGFQNGKVIFELFDLYGRLEVRHTKTFSSTEHFQIPVLKSGFYIYKLIQEDNTEWKGKLVVED